MKIFFDVDGVLIDGWHAKPERRNRWDIDMERDLGIHPDKFQEIFGTFFVSVLHGNLHLEEELDRWLKQNDHDLKGWQVINYWLEKDSKINKGVWDAVENLSQKPALSLYLATNQPHERARYLMNDLGFKSHFRDIYYSARLGCFKSDENFFRQVEEDLNFDPRLDPPLYFDDDPRNIEVSSARGWNAVLVDGPEDVTNHPEIVRLLSDAKAA
jgi:putative hydrolase of the HAD superfamily